MIPSMGHRHDLAVPAVRQSLLLAPFDERGDDDPHIRIMSTLGLHK